nr:MAG TPA: hypothetical protein [Caudoviricetes sp.]
MNFSFDIGIKVLAVPLTRDQDFFLHLSGIKI